MFTYIDTGGFGYSVIYENTELSELNRKPVLNPTALDFNNCLQTAKINIFIVFNLSA